MAATPPSIAQQPASMATPTRAINVGAPESSHGSEVAAVSPLPPSTTRLRIWSDNDMGFLSNLNACTHEMSSS
ncbi:uncharacterized protein DS421_10g292430 [Arachis hypogaea]|nr:uncharacterized protein DS421_10g292430 [Arachis hypogaea]